MASKKTNRIRYDEFEISATYSSFFEDAVRSISFKRYEFYLTNTEYLSEIGKIVLTKFENHLSVQTVKVNSSKDRIFKFSNIEVSHVLEETATLNNKRNDTLPIS